MSTHTHDHTAHDDHDGYRHAKSFFLTNSWAAGSLEHVYHHCQKWNCQRAHPEKRPLRHMECQAIPSSFANGGFELFGLHSME